MCVRIESYMMAEVQLSIWSKAAVLRPLWALKWIQDLFQNICPQVLFLEGLGLHSGWRHGLPEHDCPPSHARDDPTQQHISVETTACFVILCLNCRNHFTPSYHCTEVLSHPLKIKNEYSDLLKHQQTSTKYGIWGRNRVFTVLTSLLSSSHNFF